jgi:hypothetical protein
LRCGSMLDYFFAAIAVFEQAHIDARPHSPICGC